MSDEVGACVDDAPDGCVIRVKVSPKASGNRVRGVHGDRLKIAVTAPPEKGKANDALLRLLGELLALAPSALEIQSGHATSRKAIRVHGPNREQVCRLLRNSLGD